MSKRSKKKKYVLPKSTIRVIETIEYEIDSLLEGDDAVREAYKKFLNMTPNKLAKHAIEIKERDVYIHTFENGVQNCEGTYVDNDLIREIEDQQEDPLR